MSGGCGVEGGRNSGVRKIQTNRVKVPLSLTLHTIWAIHVQHIAVCLVPWVGLQPQFQGLLALQR